MNARVANLCNLHSVQLTGPRVPDSGNWRKITRRNLSGEDFWINKRIYLDHLLMWRVAIIARTYRLAG